MAKKTVKSKFVDGIERGLQSKRIGRYHYRPIVDSVTNLPVVWLLDLGAQASGVVIKKLNAGFPQKVS